MEKYKYKEMLSVSKRLSCVSMKIPSTQLRLDSKVLKGGFF